MLLRNLHHCVLIGLQLFAIGVGFGNHLGRADLELIALAAHVFDEDADVQGAAAAHNELISTGSGLHLESQVALQLPVEALLGEMMGCVGNVFFFCCCWGGGFVEGCFLKHLVGQLGHSRGNPYEARVGVNVRCCA